jgi:phosphoglycerate dehydrogenase-like enzyme
LFKPTTNLLEKRCILNILEGENNLVQRETLLEQVNDVNGLLSRITDKSEGELFEASKKLTVISNYAIKFNNIDIAKATKHTHEKTDKVTDTSHNY